MGLELREVSDLLERAEEDGDADSERSQMEATLSLLCHAGIVYPDTHGMGSDTFEWMILNQGFVARWFDARGDRFTYDPVLRMGYVTARDPGRRRLNGLRLSKDEILVGCVLRAAFDRGLMEGEENRVQTDVASIQSMFRSVIEADPSSVPSARRIDAILATFKDRACVRIAPGPVSDERQVTILPGIRVLFSNDYLARVGGKIAEAEPAADEGAE